MAISVFIDNNVWDYLFENSIDLCKELPFDDFCISITREAEFEIQSIPTDKAALKAFIEASLSNREVKTDSYFGFYDPSLPPNEQRVGGWGVGRWASEKEIAFIQNQRSRIGPLKKTKLFANEADVSIAARALKSVVLTFDKRGALNEAYKQGAKILYMTDFKNSGKSLAEFIKTALD